MSPFRDRLDLARHADELVSASGEPAGANPASDAVGLAPARDGRPRHPQAPQRPIPVRTVPRAAVEALVARLTAKEFARV